MTPLYFQVKLMTFSEQFVMMFLTGTNDHLWQNAQGNQLKGGQISACGFIPRSPCSLASEPVVYKIPVRADGNVESHLTVGQDIQSVNEELG